MTDAEYMELHDEVKGKIPPSEYNRIMSQPCCELDCTYLGFLDNYEDAKKYIPKGMPVIDLGCYLAAQAYMFEQEYIGVNVKLYSFDGSPLERFSPPNATHYECDIEDFHTIFGENLNEYFAIMSAVPDCKGTLKETVKKNYPNCYIAYPGEETYIQINGKEVGRKKTICLFFRKCVDRFYPRH